MLGQFYKYKKKFQEYFFKNSNVYDEIMYLEEVLSNVGFKSSDIGRKVLAREICLIERLGKEYRFDSWVSRDESRQVLRDEILQELINKPIPANDDDIRIGIGGAKPRNRVKFERRAMILLGLPASGKSTVAQVMSDVRGAYIVDSDFAKRKFPEIAFPNGASWTHEESDKLVFSDLVCLLSYCMVNDANMVIPKIGAKEESIRDLYDLLKKHNYEVSLGIVWLAPDKALNRAITRYQSSKRYIPLFKITREYKDNPLKVFEKLRSELVFENVLHLSSDVEKGEPYNIIHIEDDCVWW